MTSCADTGYTADATARRITVAEAAALHGRAGVEFIDPRPLAAISATTGRIVGARLVSLQAIEVGQLPPVFADKSLTVIAVCEVGPLASHLAAAFAAQGFADAFWLEGGTAAWAAAGHPVVR